jgi:HAD superfamily phosphatase (TIGR01668 family)
MRLLRPDETAASIFAVDYQRLYATGKRAILFDLDNTLGGRRPAKLAPEVTTLLNKLTKMGFRVGILTNRRIGTKDAVIVELAKSYPLRCRAGKPRKKGFLALLAELDVPKERAVMIGDRILTDVFGANRLGIYSIRIKPT